MVKQQRYSLQLSNIKQAKCTEIEISCVTLLLCFASLLQIFILKIQYYVMQMLFDFCRQPLAASRRREDVYGKKEDEKEIISMVISNLFGYAVVYWSRRGGRGC